MLRFGCLSCGGPLSAKEQYVGQAIFCPKCGQPNVVPAVAPAAPPPVAARAPNAWRPPAGPPPLRRRSLGIPLVLFTAAVLTLLAMGALAAYEIPRYLRANAPAARNVAQAPAAPRLDRPPLGPSDPPAPDVEAPRLEKPVPPDADPSRTSDEVPPAPPAPPAEEVKPPPAPAVEDPPPPKEPTPSRVEDPPPKPPEPPAVKEDPPPAAEAPKPKEPAPATPPPPEPSVAPAPRGPVAVKRRDEASDEDLRKQLLSVTDIGLDQNAAAALYAPLLDLQKRGAAPVPAADYGPQFLAALSVKTKRPELNSLPWQKGADCQLGKEAAERLHVLSLNLRTCLRSSAPPGDLRPDPDRLRELLFQGSLDGRAARLGVNSDEIKPSEWRQAGAIPALMQMLQTENTPIRLLLVEMLSQIDGKEASLALARRALFDLSPEARAKAVQALADRPAAEYQPMLLSGFRYPWPPAADHASEALTALRCADAVPDLINILKEPDPKIPFLVKEKDKDVLETRELVRVNHLSNCMVCHAPSLSKDDLVRGRLPMPGEDPPPLYYGAASGLFVKADTTFLRQDFSVVQPVAVSGKWPGDERFDYLVRTRPLTKAERTRYELWLSDNPKRDAFPQREALLVTLRDLAGKDLGSSYEDWKPLLQAGAKKE